MVVTKRRLICESTRDDDVEFDDNLICTILTEFC